MPSIAMFTTPLRSEMTPPSAGRRRSTAAASVACHRLAVSSRCRIWLIAVMDSALLLDRGGGRLGHERGPRRGGRRRRRTLAEPGDLPDDRAKEVGRDAE